MALVVSWLLGCQVRRTDVISGLYETCIVVSPVLDSLWQTDDLNTFVRLHHGVKNSS